MKENKPKAETPPKIVLIKRNLIDPSPENRPERSGMDEKSLGELRDSIIAHGIQQPMKVRPNPHKKGRFEIIFGERRWTAHGLAKGQGRASDECPCMVEELTDSQARELRLIENIQREGIHPLEEARGYEQLLSEVEEPAAPEKGEKPGVTATLPKKRYTIDSLSKKLGKSPAWLYGRMKLLKLPEFAQDAMFSGKLNASIALLLARIPDTKLLEKAAYEVLDPWGSAGNRDPKRALDDEIEPMSFRKAKDHIQGKYMTSLRGAPFNQDDPDLVPINGVTDKTKPCGERQFGGSCKDCPFRTGNMKALFPDVDSTDVCTNTACYKKKKDTHQRNETLRYKEKGQVLLSPGKTSQIINTYSGTPKLDSSARSQYVDLREKVPGKKGKTYEDVLSDHLPEDAMPVVAKAGKSTFLLLPIDAAQEAAKKAGIKIEAPKANGHGHDPAAQERERKERDARVKRKAAVVDAAGELLHKAWEKTKTEVLLRHIIASQAHEDFIVACGCKTDKEWTAYLNKLDVAKLTLDLMNLTIFGQDHVSWQGEIEPDFTELCKEFDVDLKKVEASLPKEEPQAEAEAKPEAKPEAAAAKN